MHPRNGPPLSARALCFLQPPDRSGVTAIDNLNLHANWRSSPQQAQPETTDSEVNPHGGAVTIKTRGKPADVELFLNDPRVAVPCHEWRWSAHGATEL